MVEMAVRQENRVGRPLVSEQLTCGGRNRTAVSPNARVDEHPSFARADEHHIGQQRPHPPDAVRCACCSAH
jgi:hypothetical protein